LDTCLPIGREHKPSNLPVGRQGLGHWIESNPDHKVDKMFFVYVIRSEINGHFYVGMTIDVEKRLTQHNKGDNRSTKAHRPWLLFFYEQFDTRIEARKREVYLKSGIGKESIKKRWLDKNI
jgi:putative endonuclease